jgi:hypothetical protein
MLSQSGARSMLVRAQGALVHWRPQAAVNRLKLFAAGSAN